MFYHEQVLDDHIKTYLFELFVAEVTIGLFSSKVQIVDCSRKERVNIVLKQLLNQIVVAVKKLNMAQIDCLNFG